MKTMRGIVCCVSLHAIPQHSDRNNSCMVVHRLTKGSETPLLPKVSPSTPRTAGAYHQNTLDVHSTHCNGPQLRAGSDRQSISRFVAVLLPGFWLSLNNLRL